MASRLRLLQMDLSSSYPLARAGGHRTVHSLLRHLSLDPDVECMALVARRGLGSQLPEYDPKLADFETLGIRGLSVGLDRWIFDCGYPVWAVDRVEDVAAEAIAAFRPDVVWSNSFLSLPLARRARELGLAAVWYIHDRRAAAEDLRLAADLGIERIAASRSLADHVRRVSGGDTEPIYPLITEDDYIVRRDGDGDSNGDRYVTLINPRPVKGYDVFLGIAPLLPDIRFLVVEAWPLGPGLGEVEERLAGLGNVRFLRQQADARTIYRQTRLLLVPSIVEEGGPRVIREAQLNGIPVLGSPRGGVPEMVGDGGAIIDDYENPAAWARAIRAALEEPARFEEMSREAARNARREDLMTDQILRQFKDACRRAIRKARHES